MRKFTYIGLANNLKNRIKHHLNDRHKNCWTHFSLYIISRHEHIKEFESVILRIADPKGNSVKGKLIRAKNLRPLLKKRLKAEWERQVDNIIGGKKKEVIKKIVRKTVKTKTERPLKGLLRPNQRIYVTYNGNEYKARVLSNGRIVLLHNKQRFDSPSMAGIAVTKRKTINGWRFWQYKDRNGELVYIDTLRK